MNYTELINRIEELKSRKGRGSISADETFSLLMELAEKTKAVDINAGSLTVRRIYTSVAAMNADKNPIDQETNKPLKFGQLACVCNSNDLTQVDNGKIYRYNKPGWEFLRQVGDMVQFAKTEEVHNKLLQVETETGLQGLKYNEIFSCRNLLTSIINGRQYANGGIFIDPKAAISNNIVCNPGEYFVIQGFLPLMGLYLTYLDITGTAVVINQQPDKSGKVGDTIYSRFKVPLDDRIKSFGVTLWRNNNDSTNIVPFDAYNALIMKINNTTELPVRSELKDEFRVENSSAYKRLRDSLCEKKTGGQVPIVQTSDGFVNSEGNITIMPGYKHSVFQVNKGNSYVYSSNLGGSGIYFLNYFDSDGGFISSQDYLSTNGTYNKNAAPMIIPSEATTVKINHGSGVSPSVITLIENIVSVVDLKEDVDDFMSENELTEVSSSFIGEGFVLTNGTISTSYGGYAYLEFDIDPDKQYYFHSSFGGSGVYYVNYYDPDGQFICGQHSVNGMPNIENKLSVPISTAFLRINSSNKNNTKLFILTRKRIDLNKIQNDVNGLKQGVEISGTLIEFTRREGDFLVRSSFDRTRDLVIRYIVNGRNMNISPSSVHIGEKELTTSDIEKTPVIHSTWDSTAPILTSNYWYLFGEHGYLMPQIISAHDKTETDLNSLWKTSDDKQFQLIKIEGNKLTFAPRITIDGGGQGADRSDYSYGYVMTNLTHVSGATNKSNITVSQNGSIQWLPFTKNIKKRYMCDGKEVLGTGVYKCNELTIIDVHEGYNPNSIKTWEPQITGGTLCRLTFTYKFTGLNCFVSNTLEVFSPIWLNYYGAFQPMGLRKHGDYDPYILIPKVKPQSAAGKISVDWNYPQNCAVANQNWAKIHFAVNSSDLLDVNDIPDRIIEYHQKPDTDEYLIGFAAGYSLLNSLTVNERRKHLTGMAFMFSQDERNKFYIDAINYQGKYGSILPAGFVGNFNFYYSYFNPSENEARVYWYKDGCSYIVYVHCFEKNDSMYINLPDRMEALTATIIECTAGCELLTDTVANGRLFASFPVGANYMVLQLNTI